MHFWFEQGIETTLEECEKERERSSSDNNLHVQKLLEVVAHLDSFHIIPYALN